MKVLLVDDEVDFATTLSKRLKLRGMRVDVVHSGEEALEYIKKREPDVMVLDLKMPGLTGMEVLRRVSKTNPDLRVIILTGHGSDREQQEARSLNAFDYLAKPTDIFTLTDRIQAAHRHRTRKAAGPSTPAEDPSVNMARGVARDRELLRADRDTDRKDKT